VVSTVLQGTGNREQGTGERAPGRGVYAERSRWAPRDDNRWEAAGFTLIELIIVISIVLILLSIAAPMYRTSVIRSREAVLRDNLFTMRALIDQYTVDKQEAPQSLQDLVTAGYLREVPTDPFTGSNSTWEEVFETDVVMNPDQTTSGITDVRSGSNLRSLTGDLYNTW
jgi:general secretion pathway protein G